MSQPASQLQFAAELVTLLVAASGLVLVMLRSDLIARGWARLLAGAGFVVIGAAAFAHGSLLVTNDANGGLTAARLAGYLALLVSTAGWSRDWLPRVLFQLGLLVSGAAAIVELSASSATETDVGLIVGGVGMAVGLAVGSRRSIVGRLATVAAGSLLLVVLVLAVALSSVISSSSQRDALDNLRARAELEGNQALAASSSATEDARFVAADLTGLFQSSSSNPLVDLASSPSGAADPAARQVAARLGVLGALYPVRLAYVVAGGQPVLIASGTADAGLLRSVAQSGPVSATTCATSAGHSELRVQSGTAVVVATYPVCLTTPSPARLLGVVLVVSPLDAAYLARRQLADPSTSLALATPTAVLDTAGGQPPTGDLRTLAAQVETTDRATAHVVGGRYYAVQPLTQRSPAGSGGQQQPAAAAGAQPVAALVVSSTGQSVTDARNRLERTLFLIALGGTVIALLLVAAVGDRITRGLRRLTEVAERVRRGDTGERADITSSDEVGTLGETFDSMMTSVEAQTAALQAAAGDETRLRNRLQAVVAGMGDALVATDARGIVTEFNAAAEELTDLPAQEAIGSQAERVLALVDEDGTSLSARLMRPDPARWAVVATLLAAGGDEIPVAVSCGALRGPAAEVTGSVLVLRDLRREQEVDRMKSEFLSRVGHELRTPLTGIMGYAEILLARQVPAPAAAQWHGEILASAKRLLRIVELLEFFAGAGAGRMLLRPEPLDVRVLVRGVTSAWADRVSPEHVVSRRVARHTPGVLADQRWLTLAIDELIDNAVKFSPDGGRVVLAAGPSADGAGVEISVVDRGVGMTAAQSEAAFAEFGQGDASDTRRFGGLGLGLALVRRVVEEHGGSVSCESAAGAGSTFTIHLPPLPAAEERGKHLAWPVATSSSGSASGAGE